jgi:hypothetical protein
MQPATDRELSDEEALAFHRHCVDLEIEQAVHRPLEIPLRSLALGSTSAFTIGHQYMVKALDHDRRLAMQLSHDTVMTRSGLGLGIIDPVTGRIR